MKTLAEKIAIVTGAGQGVGRGIALALASEGASLVVTGRTESKLLAVADEIAQRGARALAVVCDGRVRAQIEECVARTIARFGTVDILVNNAQEAPMGSLLELGDEQLQAGWESGPLAAFRFMKACHPYLRDGGVIVNLGSSTSVNPNPIGRGAYSAVKGAIVTLTRTAAVEWGAEGIRAVSVMPAAMSPAAQKWAESSPEAFERAMQAIPLRRMGDAEADIGRAVAFLCGPDARYITGTVLTLDGGQAYLR
jgi:NAD(P)-dependent dehydrogenase (short-subunit alcohol dehydrogenase family)